jgi:hypothetical protein
MPKINVIVEGQTEVTFVLAVLNPFILAKNPAAFINPFPVQTKRIFTGEKWSGGMSSYRQLKDDVRRALGDGGASCVTTMIDLFHLPKDFPGYEAAKRLRFPDRVRMLEDAMSADLANDRFLPYISTHEFEALLLTRPDAIVSAAGGAETDLLKLRGAVDGFTSPEEIDGVNPPSYRIRNVFPYYDKVRHGVVAALEAGIDSMRASCEHFREWLGRLEAALG